MRTLRAVVAVAVLILAMAAPAAAGHKRGHDVPIKGALVGIDAVDPGAPMCPAGTSWRYMSVGTGNVSHLGKVDFVVTHCTVLNPDLTGSFGNGTITFTAPNGDELVIAQWGTFVVSPDFTVSDIELSWTVVGGTGRFDGATGSGTGTGLSDIPGNTTAVDLAGRIAYDASSR